MAKTARTASGRTPRSTANAMATTNAQRNEEGANEDNSTVPNAAATNDTHRSEEGASEENSTAAATTNAHTSGEGASEENSTAAATTNAHMSREGASEENSTAANAATTNVGPGAARRTGGASQAVRREGTQGGKTPRTGKRARNDRLPQTGVRRRRKLRPGEGALKEIRKMQQSSDLLISKSRMSKVIREVTRSVTPAHCTDFRFTSAAIAALHVAAEDHAVRTFEMSNLAAIHAKRVTIQPKDMQFVRKIREDK
jgi:histone H3